jgi:acetylglutamate kinase
VKLLIKLGGTLLDNAATRESLAREIAEISRSEDVVAVHGGGRQMTQYLAERGIESHFVNGLRVTTPEILDAAVKVLAGSVNRELVATLHCAGARAVGVCGIDAGMVEAEPMDPALGSVGRVVRGDAALLHLLIGGGFLPVVACIAGDREGRIYNVNADQMAVACAAAFRAEQLIFLTDVAGVLDAGQRLLARLTLAESEGLIAAGTATGGMLAKLRAAHDALHQGVMQVRIAAGSAEGILTRILAGEDAGTRLVVQEACAI